MSSTTPLYRPFKAPDVRPTVSLPWKVLTLILGTLIIATLCIGYYLRFALRDAYRASVRDHLRTYSAMVVDAIGLPPDIDRIRKFVDHYPIRVRIERTNGQDVWQSHEGLPSVQDLLNDHHADAFDAPPDFIFREIDGDYYSLVQQGDYRAVIAFETTQPSRMIFPATIFLVVMLFILIIVVWFVIQRLLRPVNELMEGIEEVGSGNFTYRVPVRSTDELGILVSAFNAMSEHIDKIVESKRRLLFDVSHELRSPLTRMNIIIAMLPEGKQKTKLQKNANELNTMITELLENERLAVLGAALVLEDFDLVELATKVVESFGDEENRIEFDTLTEHLPMRGDSQRLTVAIRNVVSNALKYSDGSELPVKVSAFPDDDGMRVNVRDHGIGIPEEAIEKIFEPFYRTDESRTRTTGGYGLGLALTKSIIEAHGGIIRAESREGEGTLVSIWLPKEPRDQSNSILKKGSG